MDTPEIECQDCFWQGESQELQSATDNPDDTDFIYCPNCGSSDICDYEPESNGSQ